MRQSLWREKWANISALARRHDDTWYIGVINGATPRHIEIDLSFIGNGPKKIKAHIDGVNTGQQAKDSQIIEQVIKDNEKLPIDMSRGGGYTGIIHIEK